MVRPAIAPHALPGLSARQLNRTTLLRQALLERSVPEAIAGDVIRRKNGDFLPSFAADGYVAGTWSVASSEAEAILDIVPSLPVAPAARRGLTDEAERLVRFVVPDAARHGVRWLS